MRIDKRAVLGTILSVVAVVAVVKAAPILLNTDTPLAVVSSWSMEPALHVGDLIVVARWGEIEVGDVIVYSDSLGRRLIVHRVVEVRTSSEGVVYVTKGDANPMPDVMPIPQQRVKGKVVLVVPYIGVLKLVFERLVKARTLGLYILLLKL